MAREINLFFSIETFFACNTLVWSVRHFLFHLSFIKPSIIVFVYASFRIVDYALYVFFFLRKEAVFPPAQWGPQRSPYTNLLLFTCWGYFLGSPNGNHVWLRSLWSISEEALENFRPALRLAGLYSSVLSLSLSFQSLIVPCVLSVRDLKMLTAHSVPIKYYEFCPTQSFPIAHEHRRVVRRSAVSAEVSREYITLLPII